VKSGFRNSGFKNSGIRIQEFWNQDSGFKILDPGFWIQEFWNQDSGFRNSGILDSGFCNKEL